MYSRNNSSKSPASDAGRVVEPRTTSRAAKVAGSRVRVVPCVRAVRAVAVPVLVCLRSGCSHVTEVGGL